MCIGYCQVELFFPESASLKDKRNILRRLKDRLSCRYNLSIAEIGHQKLWQRAQVGMVMISNDPALVDRSFQGIRAEIESIQPGEILEFNVDFLQ